MKSLILSLASWSLLFHTSAWAGNSNHPHKPRPSSDDCDAEVDVAIIGSGASGTHAAIQLKSAGLKIAVLEKKSQIGGHAETYYDPATGAPTNIGVIVFEDSDVVQRYFAQLNVAPSLLNFSGPGTESRTFDFTLGIPIPAPTAEEQAAQQKALQEAIQAYASNVLSKYPWVDQGYFVPDPVPEELTLPFGEFAQRNGFAALVPVITQLNWYPGNISTLPTLYGIKSFGPSLLKSFTSNFVVPATGDTRSLYYAAMDQLGDDVLLNANVVSVKRRNGNGKGKKNGGYGVSLEVDQPGQKRKKIRAKKLLIAIPPTLKNLGFLDLTQQEQNLFSKFSALGYYAGIVTIPGLNISLQNVGAFTPFNEPLIPGSNGYNKANTPDGFTLGVAFDNADYSDADAQNLVRKELTTLVRAGAPLPADSPDKISFPYTSNHAPYNVRVSAAEIGAGFYKGLLGLEGQDNTYWTGAAFTGHNSALTWTWNDGTVVPALKKDLGL